MEHELFALMIRRDFDALQADSVSEPLTNPLKMAERQ
jgi:hypothetical protein